MSVNNITTTLLKEIKPDALAILSEKITHTTAQMQGYHNFHNAFPGLIKKKILGLNHPNSTCYRQMTDQSEANRFITSNLDEYASTTHGIALLIDDLFLIRAIISPLGTSEITYECLRRDINVEFNKYLFDNLVEDFGLEMKFNHIYFIKNIFKYEDSLRPLLAKHKNFEITSRWQAIQETEHEKNHLKDQLSRCSIEKESLKSAFKDANIQNKTCSNINQTELDNCHATLDKLKATNNRETCFLNSKFFHIVKVVIPVVAHMQAEFNTIQTAARLQSRMSKTTLEQSSFSSAKYIAAASITVEFVSDVITEETPFSRTYDSTAEKATAVLLYTLSLVPKSLPFLTPLLKKSPSIFSISSKKSLENIQDPLQKELTREVTQKGSRDDDTFIFNQDSKIDVSHLSHSGETVQSMLLNLVIGSFVNYLYIVTYRYFQVETDYSTNNLNKNAQKEPSTDNSSFGNDFNDTCIISDDYFEVTTAGDTGQ